MIVDGIRYDDSALRTVKIEKENSFGTDDGVRNDIKLGQKVELEFSSDSSSEKVSTVTVASEITGIVDAVSGSTITVAGQRVVVNNDATKGPVTVLDGFSNSNPLNAGKRVEVHGLLTTDGNGAYIQASRIEQKPTKDANGNPITATKITGFIANLSSTDPRTFTLGSLTVTVPSNATITPTGASLSNNLRVKVFSSTGIVNGNSITASAVRIKKFEKTSSEFRIAGVVSNVNNNKFNIENYTIDASNIGNVPTAGTYVRVKGSYNADTQTVIARKIDTKTDDDKLTTNELKGSVTDYVSNSNFSVRGTPVNATNATITGTISNGKYVEVEGNAVNGVVMATKVKVENSAPDGAELELSDSISSINSSAKTFVLTSNNKTVSYAGSVTYDNGSQSDLAINKLVKVQGQLSSGVIQAREIEFLDAANEMEVKGVLANNASLSGSTVSFTAGGVALTCTKGTPTLCDDTKLLQGTQVEVKYVSGNPNVAKRIKFDN